MINFKKGNTVKVIGRNATLNSKIKYGDTRTVTDTCADMVQLDSISDGWVYECNIELAEDTSKTVYTQEMHDKGELPAVGMSFLLKNKNADKTWARPGFYPAKMKAIGDELFIVENGATCNDKKESVGSILDYLFSPIPAPIDLIDGNAYMFDYHKNRKPVIGVYSKSNETFLTVSDDHFAFNCTNIRPMTVAESK
jgi:hypothetical protein